MPQVYQVYIHPARGVYTRSSSGGLVAVFVSYVSLPWTTLPRNHAGK